MVNCLWILNCCCQIKILTWKTLVIFDFNIQEKKHQHAGSKTKSLNKVLVPVSFTSCLFDGPLSLFP